jgi:PIN domain nuclease of toxin-antitoxin system
MTAPPLLDTHAWLWWLDGSGRLTSRTRARLDAYPDADRPALCAISLWEMALLVELGRVRLRQGFDEWIDVAAASGTVRVLDVTPAIAKELLHLPRSFHRDPADRLIVATARALDLAVLTDDGPIRQSRLVRLWHP